MELEKRTIGEVLAAHAARTPEAPAILWPGMPVLSFAGLERALNRIIRQLEAAGICAGSRVGVALPRGPEAAVASLAASSVATLLPINPNLASGDLAAELHQMKLDALIVPGGADPPAWATGAGGLLQMSNVGRSLDDFELRQVSAVKSRPFSDTGSVGARSIAVIFRTSGTTGTAKRVPVTHGNLIEMARKMERWLGLTPADRSACVMPLYYNAGFKATLLCPLLVGCSVAMPATANPQDVEDWLAELQPTWLTAAPVFLQAVLERLRDRAQARPGHSLRFVLSTASYLAEPVRTELQEKLGVPVVEFYGLGEAGMMTAPPVPPENARPGTVGRAPQGEMAIRGDNGQLLATGQTGQVMLRGPSVTPGYLADIDGEPSGLEDGWLATGDLGLIDDGGFLTIVGRTKEIINRGGEKIAPYDVEKALLLHPAVREAAVFAVPHPRLGENVGAAVVLRPGASTTSSALIEFIYDRLAPFQMPRQVHILSSLPVGATGKISRAQLSAAFASFVRPVVLPDQPLQIQIAEVWRRYLPRPDIGIDDDFFEIGGDSLQATEMLLELEEVTHHALSPSDIRAELTIRTLAESIARSVASEELVRKIRDGTGTPLFLCHGDYDGWGLYALRLVDLLKTDGPVYLLHSNLGRAPGIDTIEDMARQHVRALLAAWPRGPFRLAGYCHGGLTAWELARQLEAMGRDTESVVVIDTYSINARPLVRAVARAVHGIAGAVPARASRWIDQNGMTSMWSFTRRVLQGDRTILQRLARRLYGMPQKTLGASEAHAVALRWSYYKAMAHYLPPRIDSEVLCLLSEEYFDRKEFSPAVWRPLALNVRIERIPGKHNTCITSHVADLATTLSRHFATVP